MWNVLSFGKDNRKKNKILNFFTLVSKSFLWSAVRGATGICVNSLDGRATEIEGMKEREGNREL